MPLQKENIGKLANDLLTSLLLLLLLLLLFILLRAKVFILKSLLIKIPI